jgi:hypothetical protein
MFRPSHNRQGIVPHAHFPRTPHHLRRPARTRRRTASSVGGITDGPQGRTRDSGGDQLAEPRAVHLRCVHPSATTSCWRLPSPSRLNLPWCRWIYSYTTEFHRLMGQRRTSKVPPRSWLGGKDLRGGGGLLRTPQTILMFLAAAGAARTSHSRAGVCNTCSFAAGEGQV